MAELKGGGSDAAAKVVDSLSTFPGGVPADPKSTHPSVWSVLGEPQPETPRPPPPPRDAWGDELAAASGGLGFDEADFDATRAAADGAPVRSLPPVRSLSDGALARFDSGSAPAAGPDRLPAPLPRKPRRLLQGECNVQKTLLSFVVANANKTRRGKNSNTFDFLRFLALFTKLQG